MSAGIVRMTLISLSLLDHGPIPSRCYEVGSTMVAAGLGGLPVSAASIMLRAKLRSLTLPTWMKELEFTEHSASILRIRIQDEPRAFDQYLTAIVVNAVVA